MCENVCTTLRAYSCNTSNSGPCGSVPKTTSFDGVSHVGDMGGDLVGVVMTRRGGGVPSCLFSCFNLWHSFSLAFKATLYSFTIPSSLNQNIT